MKYDDYVETTLGANPKFNKILGLVRKYQTHSFISSVASHRPTTLSSAQIRYTCSIFSTEIRARAVFHLKCKRTRWISHLIFIERWFSRRMHIRLTDRCGVLSAESRAGQYKRQDIENAAANIRGMIDNGKS